MPHHNTNDAIRGYADYYFADDYHASVFARFSLRRWHHVIWQMLRLESTLLAERSRAVARNNDSPLKDCLRAGRPGRPASRRPLQVGRMLSSLMPPEF